MTKQLHLLTDTQLRHWMKQGEPVAKSDGGGLTFTLSAAGTASWTLRYYQSGKRREITLGNYPDIKLSDARRLASAHRAAVDGGADPAKEKAVSKAKAAAVEWTIERLAEDYRTKRLAPGSFADGTLYYRNGDLTRVIIPKLGSRAVASITGQDIVQMLLNVGDTWTISKRVLTTASKMFEHAGGLQLISINPCKAVILDSLFGARPPIKKRIMLTEDELRTVLATLDILGTENALAFRILLATCVRTSELVAAKWQDIDLERGSWHVPDATTKTRTGFYVPLMPPVVEWFRQLLALSGSSAYVLPARIGRNDGKPANTRTLWAAITKAFDRDQLTVRHFTPHDTRSTAKGHMRNLGISDFDTERALSHAIKGVSGIYDQRDELPERHNALQVWANFLLTLTPPPSPVAQQEPPTT